MTEMTMAELAQSQIAKRERARASNRLTHPQMARYKDILEPVFGPCKALWAEENGVMIGKRDVWSEKP